MTLVVDSSVATKWYVDESGAAAARELIGSRERLVAPTLILTEVANALWRKCRLNEMEWRQARRAVLTLSAMFQVLEPIEELNAEAFELAEELGHPVYDCLYVVLAKRTDGQLATADRRLIDRFRTTEHWSRIRPLTLS